MRANALATQLSLLALASALAAPSPARASDPDAVADAAAEVAPGVDARSAADKAGLPAAVGLSTGWLNRNEYGDRTRRTFAPELVGLTYLDSGRDRLYLRPGVRLGYIGLSPAEMPASVRFHERGATLAAELGALYDGVVIPSASIGGGVLVRHLELAVGPPITTDEDALSRWELMPVAYAQVGVGVPLAGGLFVIEPFARFEMTGGDDRARWRYGLDLTIALF